MKFRLLASLLLPLAALAQNPPAAAPATTNILKNGDFSQSVAADNLWDGVDSQGFLCGNVSYDQNPGRRTKSEAPGVFFRARTGRYETILEGGNLGGLAMPISVQVADINKDGLLDIVTLDGSGYFRVYFNSGTATEPKFTQSETVPVFLGRFRWPAQRGGFHAYDAGAKFALGDFDKSGTQDLVIGNYYGDLMLIKNTGSTSSPEWKQPQTIESIKVATTRDGHRWANLLAPAVYDWNKDGKMDVLLGEGSYSANTIHLLLNSTSGFGSNALPSFNEDAHEYLAYGDGREQLVPAVVDYNGDGNPDLLVGDRNGNINAYVSQGPWKKGAELTRQPQPISFGGVTSLGIGAAGMRCVAPAVADLNGDGKFDIIAGLPSGRISVSYNIGTATEPKFGPMVELKGEDLWKEDSIMAPKDWDIAFGFRQGNQNGIFSVVTPEKDPEAAGGSKNVLKFAYMPNQNKVVRHQPLLLPGILPQKKCPDPWIGFGPDGISAQCWGDGINWGPLMTDSNVAMLRQSPAIKPNTRYTLSFKVKGRNVREGHVSFMFAGWLVRDLAAIKANANAADNHACEWVRTEVDFSVSPAWTTVSRPVTFRFQKEPELNQTDKWNKPGSKIEYRSLLDIRASVNVDDGAFYVDDVQLTPM
ncbi:MAG: VCBS repeat-containing protein [Chthoniobacteraceae bacterium]|nr:VCBS repeat-containing protein [Chthoniobacteraceae bacterium]